MSIHNADQVGVFDLYEGLNISTYNKIGIILSRVIENNHERIYKKSSLGWLLNYLLENPENSKISSIETLLNISLYLFLIEEIASFKELNSVLGITNLRTKIKSYKFLPVYFSSKNFSNIAV